MLLSTLIKVNSKTLLQIANMKQNKAFALPVRTPSTGFWGGGGRRKCVLIFLACT